MVTKPFKIDPIGMSLRLSCAFSRDASDGTSPKVWGPRFAGQRPASGKKVKQPRTRSKTNGFWGEFACLFLLVMASICQSFVVPAGFPAWFPADPWEKTNHQKYWKNGFSCFSWFWQLGTNIFRKNINLAVLYGGVSTKSDQIWPILCRVKVFRGPMVHWPQCPLHLLFKEHNGRRQGEAF